MLSIVITMHSGGDIENLNSLSLPDFRSRFWHADEAIPIPESRSWSLTLQNPYTVLPQELTQCFQLISSTSSTQYAASSMGWHPAAKRKEMRLPDLKYMLLKRISEQQASHVDGFLSFMLTYEDGIEVIYCYEVHLQPSCQGRGLGKILLRRMEEIGTQAQVKKAMLTVFRANDRARRFYESLGYGEDEFSPKPRRLRGGKIKEADYIILSKALPVGGVP